MLIVESFECTKCRDGRVVFTFDPAAKFQPAGDLISAIVDERAILTLTWANGERALLPDCRDRLASIILAAPVICVRWLEGDLIRGADLEMVST